MQAINNQGTGRVYSAHSIPYASLTLLPPSGYNGYVKNKGVRLQQMLTDQEAAIVSSTRVGIIGGGQLGLMIAEAGRDMGYSRITVLDPIPHCPASLVAEQIVGGMKDPVAIRKLAARVDILTYEIEHINTDALSTLQAEGAKIFPSPALLSIIQNKYQQKEFLTQHNIPVAPFMSIDDVSDIERAAQLWGYPLVLKAKKDAYDGRGNARINQLEDITAALEKLGPRELYVEKCLELDKEIGLMIARNERGEIMTHPVVEMIHARDICQVVLAPAPIASSLQTETQEIARRVLGYLGGVGIFGIEFSSILLARSGLTKLLLVHIISGTTRLKPAKHLSLPSSYAPLLIFL